jgi:hypothetical protein
MTMELDEARPIIAEAIQQAAVPNQIEGALLTGWVIVAEYISPDGKKWLSRMDSEDLTQWLRQGMLHDALYGDEWDPEETD